MCAILGIRRQEITALFYNRADCKMSWAISVFVKSGKGIKAGSIQDSVSLHIDFQGIY